METPGLMKSFITKIFFYSQLVWHHLVYVSFGIEPERFHSNLGVTYFNFGIFHKAIAQFEKSEKARHTDDTGFARYNSCYLGFSYMNLEEYQKAVAHFEEYLRFKPNDDDVKEAIIWCRDQSNLKK